MSRGTERLPMYSLSGLVGEQSTGRSPSVGNGTGRVHGLALFRNGRRRDAATASHFTALVDGQFSGPGVFGFAAEQCVFSRA
jgi:hypothetical protein